MKSMYYKFCHGKNYTMFAPFKRIRDPKNKKKFIDCLEFYKRKAKKQGYSILNGDGEKIA